MLHNFQKVQWMKRYDSAIRVTRQALANFTGASLCKSLETTAPITESRAIKTDSQVEPLNEPSEKIERGHVTSRHVTSRHVTSRHVTSRHVTSRHAKSSTKERTLERNISTGCRTTLLLPFVSQLILLTRLLTQRFLREWRV